MHFGESKENEGRESSNEGNNSSERSAHPPEELAELCDAVDPFFRAAVVEVCVCDRELAGITGQLQDCHQQPSGLVRGQLRGGGQREQVGSSGRG